MARNKYNAVRSFVHHPPAVQLTPSIKWKVDFLIIGNDREEYYAEVKGMETEGYRLKLRLWKDFVGTPLFVIKKRSRASMSFHCHKKIKTGMIEEPIL